MLLPCTLLLLFTSSLAADCGQLGSGFFSTRSRRAIIGGNDIKTRDVPWVVRVATEYICTGTLITDRHVITAGHCFAEQCKNIFDPEWDHICLQENTNDEECSEDRKILIKKVHLLDDYLGSNCTSSSDIVLVELQKSVPSPSHVCLPFPSVDLNYVKNGKSEVHLVGYSPNFGPNSNNSIVHLQHGTTEASLQIWEKFNEEFLVSSRESNGAIMCQGDSGGPMFEVHGEKAVLVGVNVAANGNVTGCSGGIFGKQYSVEVKRHLERIFYAVAGQQ